MSTAPGLRAAAVTDIDELLALEESCFTTDRLSRRNFRWMIRQANAMLLVAETPPGLAGYILVLFRRQSRSARIYSVAVQPAWRGKGVAEQLLAAAELAAAAVGCDGIHLEVRPENTAAIRLYEKHGYQRFGILPAFYEDGVDALRLRKPLF
ncbi:MAG: GNAT family N-acetyltransferase [Gammaproteobacteria bacterium]